jgi:hypothetical protein
VSKPSCPDCGIQLVEIPDFFGSPRLKHPDVECKPNGGRSEVKNKLPLFTRAICSHCNEPFPQKLKGKGKSRRTTCSDRCAAEVRRQNLLKGRDKFWGERPKKQPREHLREYWQKRAEELDKRWAA